MPGKIIPTSFISQFGPDQYVPTLSQLSADSSYKPIPLRVAIQQYLPQPGFRHADLAVLPPQEEAPPTSGSSGNGLHGHRTTLSQNVFTRSKYKTGTPITFTHKQTGHPDQPPDRTASASLHQR